MLRPLSLLTIALLMLPGLPAIAEITVDRSVIDVTAGKTRRSDFHIANRGDTAQNIDLEIARIFHPGLPEEERRVIDNPRELGVIVTPASFTLEPGDHRKVRLSFLTVPQDRDIIYRLLVRPTPTTPKEGEKSLIRVVFNYDLLVSYRPVKPVVKYRVERTANSLTFTNTGNTNFLLYAGRECEAEDVNCKTLPGKRIYAGATHSFDISPDSGYIRFIKKDAGGTELLTY